MPRDKEITDSEFKDKKTLGKQIREDINKKHVEGVKVKNSSIYTDRVAKIARDALVDTQGYEVIEEDDYDRVTSGGENKVLPEDNINNFRVEHKREEELTYYFDHNQVGPGKSLNIRNIDLHRKKGEDEHGDNEYYSTPTGFGVVLRYSDGAGPPDYVVFMKKRG